MAIARVLGIASALLLLGPVAYAAADDGWHTILDLYNEAEAAIYNVELTDPPMKKVYDDEDFYTPEQLVEGHTVFATITMTPSLEESVEEVNITGVIRCDHEVKYQGWGPAGIIPSRIERIWAGCMVAERVTVTSDPNEWTNPTGASIIVGPMTPSGEVTPFTAPDGSKVYREEFVYDVFFEHPDGKTETRRCYAWSVPVVNPFVEPDGDVKNFFAPIPIKRIAECGATHYKVVPEV